MLHCAVYLSANRLAPPPFVLRCLAALCIAASKDLLKSVTESELSKVSVLVGPFGVNVSVLGSPGRSVNAWGLLPARAALHDAQARVSACLQAVCHSASCQRTILLHRQKRSRSTLYLPPMKIQDAVFDILHVESMRAFCADVARRPVADERGCFLIHASCLSLKVPDEFPRLRKTLASRWLFGPKSMSESRRNSQWMETRERNHAHAKVHGSARRLAWLDFATCMVQLAEVHGSASGVAWMDLKTAIYRSKMARPHARPAHHRAESPLIP